MDLNTEQVCSACLKALQLKVILFVHIKWRWLHLLAIMTRLGFTWVIGLINLTRYINWYILTTNTLSWNKSFSSKIQLTVIWWVHPLLLGEIYGVHVIFLGVRTIRWHSLRQSGVSLSAEFLWAVSLLKKMSVMKIRVMSSLMPQSVVVMQL